MQKGLHVLSRILLNRHMFMYRKETFQQNRNTNYIQLKVNILFENVPKCEYLVTNIDRLLLDLAKTRHATISLILFNFLLLTLPAGEFKFFILYLYLNPLFFSLAVLYKNLKKCVFGFINIFS